jgi:beta-xylosidase
MISELDKEQSQANRRKNPVIQGLFADPDLVKFGDTYYIYSTTDGYPGWSGTQFHVFSSVDRIEWKDEGIILDVATKEVPWAVGSAWAPCIATANDKYYFYYCAKREDGVSCIGVAEASSPTGPFLAEPHPLITPEIASEEGIKLWQTIDPSIYKEADGTVYLLFGNGTPVICQLTKDMKNYVSGSMKALEGCSEFREAVTVFKKEGLYHFTWSCDDTGSEDYHVNYGVSEALYGPVKYLYPILSKCIDKDIAGTGHHSILSIADTEECYIAYHRHATPRENYPEGKGYYRETCIDRLELKVDHLLEVVNLTE